MKKPRKIHIGDKIIKWRFNYRQKYIGIYDGKYYKIKLSDFINYTGEPLGEDDILWFEDYYVNYNGNDWIPQLTPSNIKKYYLDKIIK